MLILKVRAQTENKRHSKNHHYQHLSPDFPRRGTLLQLSRHHSFSKKLKKKRALRCSFFFQYEPIPLTKPIFSTSFEWIAHYTPKWFQWKLDNGEIMALLLKTRTEYSVKLQRHNKAIMQGICQSRLPFFLRIFPLILYWVGQLSVNYSSLIGNILNFITRKMIIYKTNFSSFSLHQSSLPFDYTDINQRRN